MGLPGVVLNVQDGNLALSTVTNSHQPLLLGVCTAGAVNVLQNFGDAPTAATALGFGKLAELTGFVLLNNGGPVQVMALNPSVQGGIGSVTHLGTGAGTVTPSMVSPTAVTVTAAVGGALGTAQFTFQIGTGPISAPVLSAGSWSSTGYLIPGTFTTVIFPAGTYVVGGTPDTYTIASGASTVFHLQGTGPGGQTATFSPVDDYKVLINIVTSGALGTSTFTYSLDNGFSVSPIILTPSGGTYTLPNTGITLSFSSTFVAGDTYTFNCTSATFAPADLATAITALQTTYLSSITSAVAAVIGDLASAAAWATQSATLETCATNLFNSGIYLRFMNQCPTLGSQTATAGAVVVDVADTDSVIITARNGVTAPHVCACAGDMLLLNPVSNLTLRRNAMWSAVQRASIVEASKSLGAVADGGIPAVTSLYRDETKTPALDAAGFTTMRSLPGMPGFFITDAHTMSLTTSDYYPFTNARVLDRGCAIARVNSMILVNSKIPTYTRNGNLGVITEQKAQMIENRLNSILAAQLVNTVPQDAVAASCAVNRTHNILSDGNLILAVAIQPYAYARLVTVNIGLAVSA